jgi:hypothetical protein
LRDGQRGQGKVVGQKHEESVQSCGLVMLRPWIGVGLR